METAAHRTVVEACPACSTKGRKTAPLTVHSLVKSELVETVGEETYRFCESPACEVVYFSEANPEHRFLRSDLRVRVGQKEAEPPIQVCYCFDWTTDDIERELRLAGTTTIPDRIKQKVQQGFCHCETMNPQGMCCLGYVNRAVKEIRARLAVPVDAKGATPEQPGRTDRTREKEAGLATLGAVFTAGVGSACCWLPLLLIAFGFSAAGVGSFFEQYRLLFLAATFGLLGAAWYLTYRAALGRTWARLRGRQVPASAVGACCAAETPPPATHSCCETEQVPADGCAAQQTTSAPAQPVGGRFTLRRFNEIMLWLATAVILLFAIFPHWVGLILGDGRSTPPIPQNGQQVKLELEGLTCEACAVTVRQALSKVPGVTHVEVKYDRAEAIVTIQPGSTVQPNALIQAVHDAGYSATFRK